MNSGNGQQYLMELAGINPEFKTIMDAVKSGNGQRIYEALAR